MSALNRRLCPGCGRVWRSKWGQCRACGFECDRPPTIRMCLDRIEPVDWEDYAGLVRGVAKALKDAAEVAK